MLSLWITSPSLFKIILIVATFFPASLLANVSSSQREQPGNLKQQELEKSQLSGSSCTTDMGELKYDAVIIPGGGLERETGLPNAWVRGRLDKAIKMSNDTRYFIVLSRGTTHKAPPLDTRHFPITEAAASAKYLVEKGIEASRVLIEGISLDTIGNAYFTRTTICDPMRLHKLVVVTSSFHMARTRAIFDWVFGVQFEGIGVGDRHRTNSIEYIESENLGMSDEMINARQSKEMQSLDKLRDETIPRYNTMEKVSSFLLQQHQAYNTQGVANYEFASDARTINKENDSEDSAAKSTY